LLARSHVIVAFGCEVAYKIAIGEDLVANPLVYVVAIFAALLPDIDEENSYIGRRFFIISLPIRMVFGHRGFTHSLLAVGLIAFGLYFIPVGMEYKIAFVIGYGSHILADALTNSGVPLLYPWDRRFKFWLTFNTGSMTEHFFIFILSIFIFLFSLSYQGDMLLAEAGISGYGSIKEVVQNFGE
jgi:inner membrane protein